MKRIINLSLGLLLFAVLSIWQIKADVRLATIFSDNMVLQQQSEVAVWGWARPNTNISVSGSWNKKSYSAKSDATGYWKIKIQTPAASYTPYTLTVSDGKAVGLKNILIGEVWLCSGQSNMEMPMKGYNNQPVEGGPDAIAYSQNKGIRCFTVKQVSTTIPQDRKQHPISPLPAIFSADCSITHWMFRLDLSIVVGEVPALKHG